MSTKKAKATGWTVVWPNGRLSRVLHFTRYEAARYADGMMFDAAERKQCRIVRAELRPVKNGKQP